MSDEDRMTIDERRKYLRMMKKRYAQADRKEQGRLLDEMGAVTGLHRKSVIRLMNGNLARKRRLKQREKSYGPEVDDALRIIAESLDHICAERLTPNLVWMAQHLAAHGEMEVTPQLLEELEQISISTVRRHLAHLQQDQPRLPRKGPERANRVTRDIPMKRIPWDEPEPGHFEVDLVHHCGPSPSGEYVHTLQMIDVATGWSERVAVLGRSYRVMEAAFQRILARLPFPVLEIHPDNGSEFMNHHLVRFFRDTIRDIELSRSRPFHKNDNRNVEQKNSTLVRTYLGYDRLDTVEQTRVLNLLYDKMWLYYNFFQPVMHLTEKIIIPGEGRPTRVKRRYDQAQTPFDRLCVTKAIADQDDHSLQALRDQTNPRQLRQQIYHQLDYLFTLPCATPGITEDVYQTLMMPLSLPKGVDSPVTLSLE
jgi:IS30 family transposase